MASCKGWIALLALALGAVPASSCAGADLAGVEDSTPSLEGAPALPLRASGRSIVDARGERLKLSAVSWSGAEGRDYVVAGLDRRALRDMAAEARKGGFNAVRLAWSNELLLLGSLTTVDPARVAANPELRGKTGMEAFDAVVKAVTAAGLMVILDNRSSDAVSMGTGPPNPGTAISRWYTADYPEDRWIADWKTLARRYVKNPLVIGADLRSGLGHDDGKPAAWDAWAAAAERAGDAVVEASPNLLVVVEGASDDDMMRRPVRLARSGRVVHDAQ